jgi:predicted ATPase/DNA-binding SARP family transcriptional activator
MIRDILYLLPLPDRYGARPEPPSVAAAFALRYSYCVAGLSIQLLGSTRIDVDGAPIAVDTRKAIALLAYLSVTAAPQPREALTALLWPDYDEESARSSLRRTLSTLRKALGGRWVFARQDVVRLDAEDAWSDVTEFRALVAESRSHAHNLLAACSHCAGLLTRAAALYRGDFMSGFSLRDSIDFEDWQLARAEELRRDFEAVLGVLVQQHATEPAKAIAYASRRLQIDPLNEAAHGDLMQLYARTGDRSAAMRQYRECVRVLEEELGVAPLEETTRLYEAIAAGEAVTERPALAIVTERREPVQRILATELPLTGRDAELQALIRFYESEPGGGLLVIEGEAGIGKTRLVQELAARVRDAGASVLAAQCYEGEIRLAYEPVIGLLKSGLALAGATERLARLSDHDLAEASRLLPELASLHPGLKAPPPLDSPGAQARFFDGLIDVISALAVNAVPGLVVVDDLHWADDASLDLLTYFVRRLEGRRLHAVLTWRSEEVPAGQRLRGLLAERERLGQTHHLVLTRLSSESVRRLVASAAIEPQQEGLTQRLVELTEGLPFFIVQYLSALSQSGSLSLPAGIHDLLRSRLARVREADLQVLTTAAVLGRSFSFDVLREASGRSEEEAIDGVEALVAQGFLQPVRAAERGDGDDIAYDFAHDALRAFVYDETSPMRRRRLHARAAEALARGAGQRPGAVAAQVGHHYRLAGRDADAASYFSLAGAYARAVHANVEALAHFRTALATGHPEPALLHEEIAAVLILDGAYGAALASYQTAAALTQSQRLPQIEQRIGGLYLRLGSWALAEEHLHAALTAFRDQEDTAAAARVLADLSLAAHRQEHSDSAAALAGEALALALSAGDDLAAAQAHNVAGIVASSRGDIEGALAHLHVSLALSERLADVSARIAALNNLALALRTKGELPAARGLIETAIALCADQGDRHREAALRNNLADLLRDEGNAEASMAQLKLAVSIFSEIGSEAGSLEPEVWKLVEW